MLGELCAIFSAVGALLTAYFMFPTFQSTALTLTSSVEDVPDSNRRGSKGEELQKSGYFLLTVTMKTPPNALARTKSIEVKGGKIPAMIVDKYGKPHFGDEKNMVSGRVPLRIEVPHDQSYQLRMYVLPDDAEAGDLEVIVRYGLFRSARNLCAYHRTHFYGE